LALAQGTEHLGRQSVGVNFEAKREGSFRTDARAYPAKPGALDSLVELESIAPECLVAIGIVAEDIASLLDVAGGVDYYRVAGDERNLVICGRLRMKERSQNSANREDPREVDEEFFLSETHRVAFDLSDSICVFSADLQLLW
jgi:hypothetical protein